MNKIFFIKIVADRNLVFLSEYPANYEKKHRKLNEMSVGGQMFFGYVTNLGLLHYLITHGYEMMIFDKLTKTLVKQ